MHHSTLIRLVVFDLDGTLVDSLRDLATAASTVVREFGGAPLSEEAVGNMVGEGAAVLVKRALAASGLDPDTPGALPRFLEVYNDHLLDSTLAYDGIDEVLASLSKRVPLAVLTNKPQVPTDRIVDALGWRTTFTHVVGGDTPFGRKPDPSGLLHLGAVHGTDPEGIALVGDSPIDLETARRAGTRICVAAYGFGFRPVPLRPGEWQIDAPRALANLLPVPSA